MDIKKSELIKAHATIVVGLSGGPDSVALLYILKQLQSGLNLTLIAAHLDHEWRANSAADALFSKQYAESLGIPFIYAKASQITLPSTKKYNGSQEELGRHLRRAFFESIAREHNAHAIALAHHQNDQQETFFVRLLRGASIAGLSGIKAQDGLYIRPLLKYSKEDIFKYLKEHNLGYVQDPTNQSTEYLRNAIRLTVIPALKACDTRFDKSFEKAHEHIKETNAFIQRLTQRTFEEITQTIDDEIWLDIKAFLSTDSFLHHALILTWLCSAKVPFIPTTSFFNEIIRFLHNNASMHHTSNKWYLIKNDKLVKIQII